MTLSDEQIHAFIEAHRKDFGETLSFDDAMVEATRLIEFFVQMHTVLSAEPGATSPHVEHSQVDVPLKAAWRRRTRQ